MYQSFEELDVWKRSCQLAVRIYDILRNRRDYGIRGQMERAAVSIASNIAEGSERGGKDFIRFLKIARGSAAELRTQMYVARRIGLVAIEDMNEIVQELKELAKMMTGLARTIKFEP